MTETEQTSPHPTAEPVETKHPRRLWIPVLLYFLLTLPYGMTKLNGDETHFVTIPYMMVGGDYLLTAIREGDLGRAAQVAAESYWLTWRYFVRPADATPTTAESLKKYPLTAKASGRSKTFAFQPDYFVTHRKGGRPTGAFLLNLPALGITYFLPQSIYAYQQHYIYHPAFLFPRLTDWILGCLILLMIYYMVRERAGPEVAFRAALIFAVMPITVIWSADLHQDVPMTFFLTPFFYYVWKKRYGLAGVFWGLAFATKNQAIFALGPIIAEALWTALGGKNRAEVIKPLWEGTKAFLTVFVVGLLTSTPFGYPWGNLKEVWDSSSPDIPVLYGVSGLFYQMPMFFGIGLLSILGARLMEKSRDQFDRLHISWLLLPLLFHFIHDYRNYMLVPSVAILLATYLRKTTLYLVLALMMAINVVGYQSPYLTSRHLMYDWLNDPGAPKTIQEIERLPGMGSIPTHTGGEAVPPNSMERLPELGPGKPIDGNPDQAPANGTAPGSPPQGKAESPEKSPGKKKQ